MPNTLNRRNFLQTLGSTAAFAGCASAAAVRSASSTDATRTPTKRILILGGTGFIGPAIVQAARARGHVVTLFNRGKTNPHLFPDVETIIGERSSDLTRVKGRRWDAVIDTWTRYPSAVREATTLLRDSIEQYLFVSTISVYKLGRDPITETSPVLTSEDPNLENMDLKNYGPLKVRCEQAAESIMPQRVTVVRPGVIAGPGDPTDRFTYWPVRLARGGSMLVPGDPGCRMQFIDVRDLAAFLIGALEARHVGIYNAVGPTDPELRSVLPACRSGIPSAVSLEWVDGKWLQENDAGDWNDFPLVVTPDSPISGFAQVSAARAVAKGLRFRPLGDTTKDTLAWWSSQPAERRNKPRPGLTAEREAELLKRWSTRTPRP